jgi:hypothetical protein
VERVRLDLNNPAFQECLFNLPREDQARLLATLRKLVRLTWDEVYHDSGTRWEAILSRRGPGGARLYNCRISKGFRAVACRDGQWMRLLSLHPDHDSAY